MNVDNNEQLQFAIFQANFMFPPTPGLATTATVRVVNVAAPGVLVPIIDPVTLATVTTVHLNLPGPGAIKAASPLPQGIYAIVLSDVNGHFRMQKGSGTDKGIYVGWDTGHQGIVKFTVDPGNVPFSDDVQINVFSPLTGEMVANGAVGVGGFEDTADVGHYHLEFTAPAGYKVEPSSMDIDITCDKLTKIDLKIYAITNTNVSAQTITYNADGQVVVTVDSPAGVAVTSGSVSLTVDGGAALTQPLSGGSASFNVGVLNAGNHALMATYTDVTDGHFLSSTNAGSLTVDKAESTVTVTCSAVTYNGAAQTPCTAVATGVGGLNETLNPLTYSNNINAGVNTASASASFAGDTNHNLSSGSANFTINKADPTISVTGYSVTYDAGAHTATGTAKGVLGENLAGLNLTATTHTAAGNYTDGWTFTDVTGNYNNASGTVADAIAKANPTIVVTPYSVIYDGASHTATGSAKGVLGENLAGLNLGGTTHTAGGTYTDGWTFTDVTGNYNNVSGNVTDVIARATTTTTLSTSVNPSLLGTQVIFTANVTSQLGGVVGGTVVFTDNGVEIGRSSVGAGGLALLPTSTLAVGSHPIVATYLGDDGSNQGSASAPLNQIVYAFAGTGAFVIGDKNAINNTTVTFWDAQWEKKNSLTGPMANASFKGFANWTSTNPPAAGGNWRTDPGNSSNPPASIPAYMGIIVASTDVKNGSTISGNIVKIVIVKTNAGYDANPGHAGTGTIISILP
jgi:hypothetical protein